MKKFFLIVLSFIMAITCLCGCGDNNTSESDSSKEQEMDPIYQPKQNVITDRQSYTEGSVQFPNTLWQTPNSTRAAEYDRPDCGAEGYFIESVQYKGFPTNVFVYVGMPEGASAENPVPGVILVHGGGGTAFPDWVKTWTQRGYAAISVDTEGHVPKMDANVYSGDVTAESPLPHGPTNPQFSDCGLPIEQQWMYHAVAATIVAHSFLKSMPEVDSTKIGMTGISWGSVVVANTVCYDDRLAFCAPVYGGLSMKGTAGICGQIFDRYPSGATIWNGTEALEQCRTPLLFVNWNKDPYFTIDATTRCAEIAPYGSMVLIENLLHGHLQGGNVEEIFTFANNICKGANSCLPQITQKPTFENPVIKFDSQRSDVIYGTLFTTKDTVISENTVWESAIVLISGEGEIALEIDSDVKAFYVTLTDAYDVEATSPVAFRE